MPLLKQVFLLVQTFTIFLTYMLVDAGHKAVIFDRLEGVKNVVKGEGLNFIVPILQVLLLLICYLHII